jgi:hypothetical protein
MLSIKIIIRIFSVLALREREQKKRGENLKVVWVKFSTLSWGVSLLEYSNSMHKNTLV